MDTFYLLLVCLPVAGLVTWRLLIGSPSGNRHERMASSRLTAVNDRSGQPAGGPDAYKAFSLLICNRPCSAAVEQRGKSFLAKDAPALPLQGCDRVCHCGYASHDDRRINNDRRNPAEDFVAVVGKLAVADNRARRNRRARRFEYKGIY